VVSIYCIRFSIENIM